MMLHPPMVVENLLPHAGTFELVDQVRSECGPGHIVASMRDPCFVHCYKGGELTS